jgi:hypothetical protein
MTNLAVHEHMAVAPVVEEVMRTAPQRRFVFIAPRHADGGNWPWLSRIGPMRKHRFESIYIENTCETLPKATRLYVRWQYLRAMRAISAADLAFFFSTDVGMGMTFWLTRLLRQPKRVYVGFTQDAQWSLRKIERLGRALRQFDAVTVFSEDERRLYINRYDLQPERVNLIPIHTDEVTGYEQYDAEPPLPTPYVLSMGSPNRRFMPVAKACRALNIPLVIITRPTHRNDSLHDLANLGATIITNANRFQALSWLRHARLASMVFQTPTLPGAFTTLIHSMFLRTPSVVTQCLGMTDYVKDGETGFITPHSDDEALTEAIGRLWNDAHLRERFACNGLLFAQREFSLEAAAQKFHDLAEHVLQSDRSRAASRDAIVS